MKRILFVVFVFCILVNKGNAQLSKNSWLVGGSGNFSSAKEADINDHNFSKITIQVSPKAGYFFIDKLAAGIQISINSQNYPADNGISYYTIWDNSYGFGPFVRYYFLQTEKQLNLFFEAGDLFSISTSRGSSSLNSNAYSFSAGPVFYFNEHVGLEFTIGYTHNKWQGYSGEGTIQIGLGLQIHLKKGG